ncbi:hypothetical protein AB0I50_39970, partial [Streptomyces prunicolor]
MHPMVKPALRRGWRDLHTVQFGMTPAHAMTLGPMDTAALLDVFIVNVAAPTIGTELHASGADLQLVIA